VARTGLVFWVARNRAAGSIPIKQAILTSGDSYSGRKKAADYPFFNFLDVLSPD
jgi:hypothetical protein